MTNADVLFVRAALIVVASAGCTSRGPRQPAEDSARATPADLSPLKEAPAGRALLSWMEGYNTGRRDTLTNVIARLYSQAALERRPADVRVATFQLWWKNYGRFTAAHIDSVSPWSVVVTVREELTGGWGTLYVDVDSVVPNAVTGVALLPFREPPAWNAIVPITSDEALAAVVERLADRLSKADAFSGVVMLTHNGKAVVRRAYGLADRESVRANTLDTRFQLASVSKMFTAVTIAQLAEEGKLSLDASIGSILPDYPVGDAASYVTVHHLLTMSSGIPDLFSSPKYWSNRAAIRSLKDYWPFFAAAPLEFEPGHGWSYSNSNFLILGAIIERLTRIPFATAVQERVFARAGMDRTSYSVVPELERARGYTHLPTGSPPDGVPNAETWFATDEEERRAKKTALPADGNQGSPAGGGVASADDLVRFAQALLHEKLLRREMMAKMMTGYVATEYDGRDGYGLETRTWNGVRIVGHGGGFTGVSNQVDFYPDLGYVLVVLANSDASGAQAIANGVRVAIAGSPALPRAQ